jgi:epothilone synthetase B
MSVSEQISLRAKGTGSTGVAAGERRPPNEFPEIHELLGKARFNRPFPLTDIQQAYWIGRQEGFSLGNISAHGYMELDCFELDIEKFSRVFNKIIHRHDMLRAFVSKDGMQHILADVPEYRIRVIDLCEADTSEKQAKLESIRQELSHQVLDASVWPLFDIRATRMTAQTTRIHFSLDVLIFDAHSFDLIGEELNILYQDETSYLTPLNLSFADYVHALNHFSHSELYKNSVIYWRKKLALLPPGPELPLATSPGSIVKPEFTRRCKTFDCATWNQFKENAKQFGLTPSSALLTVYGYVLSRWSSNKRFTLNLTLFNRLPFHEEVNKLVGDFTSVVLLAMDYSVNVPFHQQAAAAQEQLWNDLDHRFVSGVWVLRELQEAQRGNGPILMPVVFTSALKPENPGAPSAMSWLGEVTYTITQTPQVWLDHQIGEDRGQLVCDWDAVEELFPVDCLDAMFAAYTGIITELSAVDTTAWSNKGFDVLPVAQKELIASVNNTRGEIPSGLLHSPVLARCQDMPDNIALIQDEQQVSYQSLYQYANCLAHKLWQEGLESNELVAVLLPKGIDQVIAVLGILEAGASYVPIEASYPEERINQLLELAGISKIISIQKIVDKISLQAGIHIIDINECKTQLHNVIPLPPMQEPSDTAYIIYTSGSTGVPKGVVIDHRGALNTVIDINKKLGIGENDRVLALSALNFDLSVYDIFGLLAAGGAIVFPSVDSQHEPASWAELINRHQITLWNTVPALIDIYVSYLHRVAQVKDTHLRWILMSGDWINLGLPDAISASCQRAQAISLGGATEASIWSIWYPITAVKNDWSSIPYGKPLANQSFHILDECMQPCPIAVVGELYIGGIGLAKEYWRTPDKTAYAFVSNPHTQERLYRTGDLGRYLADGNIEFLGRSDLQVKINGYRVELGEVEAAMLALPEVQAAVAHVIGESGKTKRLVGYFVRDTSDKQFNKIRFSLTQPGLRQFPPGRVVQDLPNANLPADFYTQRQSHRSWSDAIVPLEKLSRVLASLGQQVINGRPKYKYGSAGSLYPVQCYVHLKADRVEQMGGGLFYYHPVQHQLIPLQQQECLSSELFPEVNQPLAGQCAFQIFLIANLDAIAPVYKESSRDLCMLEAGLMTQLIEQEAAAQGLGMCQTGGFNIAPVASLFELDFNYAFIHSLMGGMPASEVIAVETVAPKETVEKMLLTQLREKLPAYMVPDVFIELDKIPLSANGKVDRKMLPIPQVRADNQRKNMAPTSTLAKKICGIWSEVLDRDDVGVEDNFFDMGGTSVEMIKIHTWLEPELPQKISLIDMFFTYPTISSLVAHLNPDTEASNGVIKNTPRRRSLTDQKERRKSGKNNNIK